MAEYAVVHRAVRHDGVFCHILHMTLETLLYGSRFFVVLGVAQARRGIQEGVHNASDDNDPQYRHASEEIDLT